MERIRESDRSSASKMLKRAATTACVLGGAAAVGFARGRFGPQLNIAGSPVPWDLTVGVAGHLLGWAGAYGKYDDYGHAVFDGVLAGYVTVTMIGVGGLSKEKATLSSGDPKSHPRLAGGTFYGGMPTSHAGPSFGADVAPMPMPARGPLTPAELMGLAQAAG